MKIVVFGTTNFSRELLLELIDQKYDIVAVFSTPQKVNLGNNKRMSNYNYAGLIDLCNKFHLSYYEINNPTQQKEYADQLKKFEPDVLLMMGWYYIVPEEILRIPKYGAWGIHCSLLPKYAGWAPLVWAVINGETETGVTLFKMSMQIDSGEIIDQKSFGIDFHDSIKEVYQKAVHCSKDILLKALRSPDQIRLKKQKRPEFYYPRRTPEDGKIDLSKSAIEIHNFIRAQSSPYPGAFILTSDNRKLVIDKAHIED